MIYSPGVSEPPEGEGELSDTVLTEMARHLVASPVPSPEAEVAPEQRYEVGELIGSGGMATVYRAIDRVLARPVALKLLRDERPQTVMRFQREARIQARVEHPRVCRVYDV